VELEFALNEVEVGQAQVDFFLSDCLTLSAGRFLAPIGFFNEQQYFSWINKFPDFPAAMLQVSRADFSINGLQLRGATYLGDSPVKSDYAFYAANGLGVPLDKNGNATLNAVANLDALNDTSKDANNAVAYGGRVGFWVPKWGVNAGVSGFFNRPYTQDTTTGMNIDLWNIFANYTQGNWDFHFEGAQMFQKTVAFIGDNIVRRGFYAQLAYRPYDCPNDYLQKLQVAFRYSYTHFNGFDPAALDLSQFNSPVDSPADRNQYAFGIDYYFQPSMVLKFAYELNYETGNYLKDNVFMSEFAWNF